MGAWIETLSKELIDLENKVAPRMGAWVETILKATDSHL